VVGSYAVKENGQFYNRLVWMQPDNVFYTYDKRHLFSYAHEEKTFSAGTERLIIEWRDWKFCPLICYDLRFPVWSRNRKDNFYDCLIYVANWPERRALAWNALLKAVGNDGNGIYYAGESSAYDFLGNQIAFSAQKEETLVVELHKEKLNEFRKNFPVLEDGDGFELGYQI